MNNYTIPGVYVEEIPKFPPSIAQVPTAIPAFIGYTQIKESLSGKSLINQPVRVSSQKEFEQIFGMGKDSKVKAIYLDENNNFIRAEFDSTDDYYLYDAIRCFYANGGGDCYVLSVGNFEASVSETAYTDAGKGFDVIAKIDEPTILLFPDAVKLDPAFLGNVQKKALMQCGELKDRVTICDLRFDNPLGKDVTPNDGFRSNIGINDLKYGMAYTPWLSVVFPKNISFQVLNQPIVHKSGLTSPIEINDNSLHGGDTDIISIFDQYQLQFDLEEKFGTYSDGDHDDVANISDLQAHQTLLNSELTAIFGSLPPSYTQAETNFNNALNTHSNLAVVPTPDQVFILKNAFTKYHQVLRTLLNTEQKLIESFSVYKNIINGINASSVHIPPSGAVAGIFAYVDRTRGVWKAPANVSLSGVLGPSYNFTQSQLEELNIDPNAGKSINAIRSFTGKGTLIFGARTLAGNDNEWRYVPVRRFFNMVEESVKKACEQFVFEPNDANTWTRIQAMIENFLFLQWRDGALQGVKPEHAYFVAVGLGKTMTAQDILEGRLIVEIGMAPVRPAEFIILRFSQKMAES